MSKDIMYHCEIIMVKYEAKSTLKKNTLDKLLVIGFPLMSFVKLSYRFASESISTTEHFSLLCCSLELAFRRGN